MAGPYGGLRQARIDMRLSQAEFACLLERLAREKGESVECSARLVRRWESGQVSCPRPVYQRLLEQATGRRLGELGFGPDRSAIPDIAFPDIRGSETAGPSIPGPSTPGPDIAETDIAVPDIAVAGGPPAAGADRAGGGAMTEQAAPGTGEPAVRTVVGTADGCRADGADGADGVLRETATGLLTAEPPQAHRAAVGARSASGPGRRITAVLLRHRTLLMGVVVVSLTAVITALATFGIVSAGQPRLWEPPASPYPDVAPGLRTDVRIYGPTTLAPGQQGLYYADVRPGAGFYWLVDGVRTDSGQGLRVAAPADHRTTTLTVVSQDSGGGTASGTLVISATRP